MLENYTTKKTGLVVLGDVHGNWASLSRFCWNFNDFCIIQVGDFGMGFNHPEKEKSTLRKLNRVLKESNNELIAIRGNHDDPKKFQSKWVEDEILLAADYQTLTWKDKSIQMIGGGISIDRTDRIYGRSWWDGEELIFSPEKIKKVDILITHVAPTAFPLSKAETNSMVMYYHNIEVMQGANLLDELAHEKVMTQNISDLSECKRHYFGHHHRSMFFEDKQTGREYVCLDIDEFREVR